MDTTAEFNSEEVSSSAGAAAAAERAEQESTDAEVGSSEPSAPLISGPDPIHEPDAHAHNGEVVRPGAASALLELIPISAPRERAPFPEAQAAKTPRNFAVPGLAAGLALLFLLGAGAVYERMHQTALLAMKVQENEHLVSTVSNLTQRLDAIEAVRAREETADIRKVLGEIKLGASATREVNTAVAQLVTRVNHVERDQSSRLDKLAERIDHDSSPRFADLASRLDRLEKKAAAPVIAPVAPASRDVNAAVAQLTTRVDHVERDQSVGLDKLAARIDHDSSPRFADLAARLDRLEKKASSPTVSPVASAPPKQIPTPAKADPGVSNETTGSIEKPKPPLRGYSVVDVHDGFAMIAGNEGSLAVAPGDIIPGLGRVLRIERHGRDWAVVTSLGVILSEPGPY